MFDIILSFLALVCSSPIWIVAIIGIELSDPGPVFYKANRIGKDNKEFGMYKFRSMRVLNEPKAGSEASLRPETERIFPWGKVIRKLKIDELPQFLNIFFGERDIIGTTKKKLDFSRLVMA
jgi:lipopolysaccharide/colanic/teichoic acid biosynthesis glycosyltransferase